MLQVGSLLALNLCKICHPRVDDISKLCLTRVVAFYIVITGWMGGEQCML